MVHGKKQPPTATGTCLVLTFMALTFVYSVFCFFKTLKQTITKNVCAVIFSAFSSNYSIVCKFTFTLYVVSRPTGLSIYSM